ncbi:MAG: TonB-dependent receptor [Lewinellaceae bacterium]|nr:TonB-dependent receptor [Saprospiraceae bacterium]MCB9331812.1 TonB-dependent receptor [Lewinellaceae bacterium]
MKKLLPCLVLCLMIQQSAAAQKNTEPDTTLEAVPIRETVVAANRSSQSRTAVAQQVTVLRQAAIQQANAQTTADLMTNAAGIFVQKSQQGGGSPVLRGFEANRVLLVVDGIRMNNAIYRAGHLQNIITLDNAALDRVEVLFGPASTVYGSDALGGAICFFTKKPKLAQREGERLFSGSAFARYGTVNQELTAHTDVSIGWKKLAVFGSYTVSDFGDLRMGANTGSREPFGERPFYVGHINGRDTLLTNVDPLVQRKSAYRQQDVVAKILWQPNERITHTGNAQFSNSSNIPRYDRLTDPDGQGLRNAEWYYGPQKRQFLAYHLNVEGAGWFDRLGLGLSWQDIEESRNQRRFDRPDLQRREENVKVYGLETEAQKNWTHHSLRVGLDGQFNRVNSTAREENIETGVIVPLDTRYPNGGSTMYNLAAFATHNWQGENNTRWSFSEGIRVGFSGLSAKFTNKTFFPFPFDDVTQNTPVWSASLGTVWRPVENWRLALNASSGFRVPNVDDLGKVFESQPGAVLVPNPDIKPEQSFNLDLNLTRHIAGRLHWENVLWVTALRDAIVTDFFQFNGEDSIVYDGTPSRVLASQNKDQARLWGFSSNLEADVSEKLAAYASLAYTYGRVVRSGPDQPLDHIPPFHGRAGLRFHSTRLNTECYMVFNSKKPIDQYSTSGEDNQRYAPADGMPGWYTVNLRVGYHFNTNLQLQAGIDNLLDRQYRYFASGINAPGRNFWVTLRASWETEM